MSLSTVHKNAILDITKKEEEEIAMLRYEVDLSNDEVLGLFDTLCKLKENGKSKQLCLLGSITMI